MSERLELAVFSANGLVVTPLNEGHDIVVGRGTECDIVIEDDAISRRHVVLRMGKGRKVEVEDVSAHGTFLSRAMPSSSRDPKQATKNPKRERIERATLGVGDSLFVGAAVVVLRAAPNGGATESERSPLPARPRRELRDAVVEAPETLRVYEEAERAAKLTLPILLYGETGVGKDVLARFIHEASPRAKGPLVAVNCAALSETMAESELFGHERGAFTGAHAARAGLFESAHGGTVFLDEIGELPLTTQAKLLRTLESSEVQRLGNVRPIKVDFRLVSATNRDLQRTVQSGRFRQDLFFRINGFALRVPPLRERRRDIAPLARRFLEVASAKAGLSHVPEWSDEAIAALEAYEWPGNVRELRFVVERTMVTAGAGPIRPEHLPSQLAQTVPERVRQEERVGREVVVEALRTCDGNQTRAAALLGISRRTLINRMIEYGLPRPRKDSTTDG